MSNGQASHRVSMILGIVGLLLAANTSLGAQTSGTASDASAAGQQDKPYKVVCEKGSECKVDKTTYIGWRSYSGFCLRCHGESGLGSSFAPSLLDRLQGMSETRFKTVVTAGFKGEVGVMPSFAADPNVMPRLNSLWAYLKARADGVLPPGRPARLN